MSPETFTALDFETAQGYRWSICQVGLVRVVDGQIADEISLLVRPPENFYWRQFSEIHGIRWWDTQECPSFADIWPQIRPWIEGQTVVAHNGAFDFTCLRRTLDHYQLPHPTYQGHCTYQIYRRNLADLCAEHGIPLNHHDALSDAHACAELYLRHLNQPSTQLAHV